ncbi:MAG: ABC transporter ATP-binding protein [Actinomycetes bacterium]
MKTSWNAIKRFLDRPRRRIAGLVVLSIVNGLLEASVILFLVGAVAESVGEQWSRPPMSWLPTSSRSLVLLAVIAALLVLAVDLLNQWLAAHVHSKVLTRFGTDLLGAFSLATYERQQKTGRAQMQQMVGSLAFDVAQTADVFTAFVSSVSVIAVLLTVSAIVNPVATVVVVGLMGIAQFVIAPIGTWTKQRGEVAIRSLLHLSESLSDYTENSREYRLAGTEAAISAAMDSQANEAGDKIRRSRFMTALGSAVWFDVGLLILVCGFAVLQLTSGDLITGTGAAALIMVRVLALGRTLQFCRQQFHALEPRVDIATGLLDDLRLHQLDIGNIELPIVTSVSARAVSYSYNPGDTVLRGISLAIEHGEVVGLVGPSGAGKSTLAQLLVGLRAPTDGEILVDEVPMVHFESAARARTIAYVPQDPRMIEASIAENIRLLRTDIDDEAVRVAAKAAHIHDEIMALPEGYETLMGARGIGLSGGQVQRIALARALAGLPQVLVLDEPTSALDAVSERGLQQTIARLSSSMTMVIVAHRLSTLESCSRIVVLEAGQISADGTSAELLAQPGFFRTIQQSLVDPFARD